MWARSETSGPSAGCLQLQQRSAPSSDFNRPGVPPGRSSYVALAVSSATLTVCGAALATRSTSNLEFGLAFSLTVLLAIMAIRRLEIGIWGAVAVAAVVLTLSISIVWIQYGHRSADLMTAYSDNDRLVGMTRRMLADTPWLGNGPGSFQMLANIYRQPLDVMPIMKAPTAAAKIAIELGRPCSGSWLPQYCWLQP